MEFRHNMNHDRLLILIPNQNSASLQNHFKQIEFEIELHLSNSFAVVEKGLDIRRPLDDPNGNFFQTFTVLEACYDNSKRQQLGMFICWMFEQYRLGKYFIPVTIWFDKNSTYTFRPYQSWNKAKNLLLIDMEVVG